jgi:hypothetical protein
VKSISEVTAEITRRLRFDWHTAISGQSGGRWPHILTLGEPTQREMEADFDVVRRWALDWQQWAQQQPVELRWRSRRMRGTTQRLPTHIVIADASAAAKTVGGDWASRLARGAARHRELAVDFGHLDLAGVVRAVDTFTDVDVDLLRRTAIWFTNHDATGLTPRQVPIEGLHSKWLNNNRHLVATLSGKDDLGLNNRRPTRVHFTYLDPGHVGRRYDSVAVSDLAAQPLYSPDVVIICENRDTAQLFPPMRGGIAVEGDGLAAAGVLPHLSWVAECPHIFYWGDIDAAGYEIVHLIRTAGIDVVTILMDEATYQRYERFGATTDHHGAVLKCSPRKPLAALQPHERVVYDKITDPEWRRPRRIEQERIPLQEALAAIAPPTFHCLA